MGEQICYALLFLSEAVIVWLYFDYVFSLKKTLFVLHSSFFIGYAVLFGLSQFGSVVINAISFCVVNLTLVLANYKCKIRTGIFHAAYLTFIMLMAEVLVALLLSGRGYDFDAYTYDFFVMIVLTVLSKMLFLLLAVISARVFQKHKHPGEEPQFMVLFFSLPILSTVLAIVVIYIGANTAMTGTTSLMMFLVVSALLVVNLLFMVLYNSMQQANENYLSLQLSIQKEQADTEHYRTMQEQYERQQTLIHDIKNHLHTIGSMAHDVNAIEIEAYITSIEGTTFPKQSGRLCDNSTLNTILLRAAEECVTNGIDIHIDIREGCTSFMDAPSITSLYGNLLSNAIEAAKISKNKTIEVTAWHDNNHSGVVISIINSCDIIPPVDVNGNLITTKKNKRIHGVGTKSIARTVAKYNGIATNYYNEESCQFCYIVRFPSA